MNWLTVGVIVDISVIGFAFSLLTLIFYCGRAINAVEHTVGIKINQYSNEFLSTAGALAIGFNALSIVAALFHLADTFWG